MVMCGRNGEFVATIDSIAAFFDSWRREVDALGLGWSCLVIFFS